MFEPNDAGRVQSAATDDRHRDVRRGFLAPRRPALTLLLGLAVGLALGGCALTFGNGAEPTSRPSQETPRDRNRLFLEEQERLERQRTFDRVGPSER